MCRSNLAANNLKDNKRFLLGVKLHGTYLAFCAIQIGVNFFCFLIIVIAWSLLPYSLVSLEHGVSEDLV